MGASVKVNSQKDIRLIISDVHEVRSRGFENHREEQENGELAGLVDYLNYLADKKELKYPFIVEKRESPDFLISWEDSDAKWLIEMVRAMNENFNKYLRVNNNFFHVDENNVDLQEEYFIQEWKEILINTVKKKNDKLPDYKTNCDFDESNDVSILIIHLFTSDLIIHPYAFDNDNGRSNNLSKHKKYESFMTKFRKSIIPEKSDFDYDKNVLIHDKNIFKIVDKDKPS